MARSLIFSTREIQQLHGLKVAERIPGSELGGSGPAAAVPDEVAADLEFSVGGSSILLLGRLRGNWKMECSRCLKEFSAPFESALEETYPVSQETIDAREEIRQGLALAAPTKPLCRPDCRGLCTMCGADLNEGACGCAKT